MKRLTLLIATCLLALGMSAQTINRTIMGLTLGKTTVSEAKSIMANKGISLTYDKDSEMYFSTGKVSFAGTRWNTLALRFYQGKLMLVAYQMTSDYTSDDALESTYNTLKRNLSDKYSDLVEVIEDWSGDYADEDYGVYVRDDKTFVHLTKPYMDFLTYYVVLFYRDDALYNQMRQSNMDEL